MTPEADRQHSRLRRLAAALAALFTCAALGAAFSVQAQPNAASAPPRAAAKPAPEQGVRWRDLKPEQQNVLRPLEREWATIGSLHKDKWIELSRGFSKRPAADQARIQARMTEWARLTTQERSQARLNFQEAAQLPATDRKARWDAYQALPAEKKQQLAARAAPAASVPNGGAATPANAPKVAAQRSDSQAKSNIVPNPAFATPRKVVAPTVVQARPGASTTLITKRPTPPTHQQTGLPKIAATPEFVNKATLLPQRGPQAAATRSAASSAPPETDLAQ